MVKQAVPASLTSRSRRDQVSSDPVASRAHGLAEATSSLPAEGQAISAGISAARASGVATTFFEVPARGHKIVFVIDRSASMGLDGAFAAVQNELRDSLTRLAPEVEFQVIAYNRSAEPLRLGGRFGWAAATAQNTAEASAEIAKLRAEGGTDHLAALKKALMLQPDVVYFLTDADGISDQTIRLATAFNRGHAIIHAIFARHGELAGTDADLGLLSRANGGMHRLLILDPSKSR